MPTDIDVAVGRNIQHERRTANVNQQDLGTKVKISGQQISKYERGQSQIAVNVLVNVAKALNISAAVLLPQQDGQQQYVTLTSELKELMTAAKQPKMRWLFLQIAEMPSHQYEALKCMVVAFNGSGAAKPQKQARGRPRKRK